MEALRILKKNDEELKTIWNKCLDIIKTKVYGMTFETWFKVIVPLEFDGNNIKLLVPNNFFYEFIDQHYSFLIKNSLLQVIGKEIDIFYEINNEEFDKITEAKFVDDNPVINQPQTKVITEEPKGKSKEEDRLEYLDKQYNKIKLNPKYTFENFVRGENNQLAHAAALAISQNPAATAFNPFFVYGGTGLGKTHLIQAIGNRIFETFPEKKVVYISSENFTVDFIDAVTANTINEFSNYYKTVDILIIDDIQFLSGKEKTQDLLFHIFNTLHQSGKQIILSSDKPPRELKGLNERLISRFSWGLTADVQTPDLETRIAILQKKISNYNVSIPKDVIHFVATNITSNVRELEGALNKLVATASLSSSPIDINLAKKVVKEITNNVKVTITIDSINKVVAKHLGVSEDKLRDKTRKKEIVQARMIAIYLAKELTKNTLKSIGLHFGGRDHTTVMHAIDTIAENIKKDFKLKQLIDTIRNEIELGY
ncbi:MAG TPA: chromosomal replication initiator protein DnaA [Ignavibacteriales bacterium]|nr:chromosomal replication initiator protein DnaA [Ignavibacteriales bacterium]HOL80953.1 chromosomal replication initiator protein DnaA [Ignavibacteriales bacterium]HOM64688.1 chromosomal replication initiator protein DnaA [Ignavibacteriales bacterium]HPD66780.1 chromosomal replication initiator protein DnaA [Ignavibacteriales bacterium]HPP32733.1 chromosomal replication initiator protein DnaA [Ignavibacteriales bacterium]